MNNKMRFLNIFLTCFMASFVLVHSDYSQELEDRINQYLTTYNEEADMLQYKDTLASWEYEIDMTDENKEKTTKMSAETSAFALKSRDKAKELLDEVGSQYPNSMNKSIRQLKLITRTASTKNKDKSKKLADILSQMTAYYSKTSIIKTIGGDEYSFKLNSHLLPIMADVSSNNLGNLKWAWKIWRKAVGPKVKPLFEKYVNLSNEGARENGFQDYGDYWRKEYEVDDLEGMMENILMEMFDLYKKLHAFTRYKLHKLLGGSVVDPEDLLPAHLLSMWGQNWVHLFDKMVPFPNKTIPDVTKTMRDKGWNATNLLKLAESFFTSIGLDTMPKSFYEKSLITKKAAMKSVCHPSSWDLGKGDVRLKMPCMGASQGDLITVHHEMGHIEYYLLYKDQPVEFRTGANPGFHEAVGDTISLSVMIPEHLSSIGLLDDFVGDEEEQINFLLKQALQKISFIPFSYIIDKWRWDVFSGEIKPEQYNDHWWALCKKYQGIKPPMEREETNLFDPGTFFHVAHSTEYLRYFLSHVLQFQFHEALCDAAGHQGPYHNCTIHKSKKAGEKLRTMLELGKELPWPNALATLTGSTKLSPKAILDYFKPLEVWLDAHRDGNNYKLGWD